MIKALSFLVVGLVAKGTGPNLTASINFTAHIQPTVSMDIDINEIGPEGSGVYKLDYAYRGPDDSWTRERLVVADTTQPNLPPIIVTERGAAAGPGIGLWEWPGEHEALRLATSLSRARMFIASRTNDADAGAMRRAVRQ